MNEIFSFKRFFAVVLKEFIQMRRDRMTFAMMAGIPVMQLLLFGFAINSNPKNLPCAVVSADPGTFTRTIVAAMKNSEYFSFTVPVSSAAEAEKLMKEGELQFVVHIPENFTQKLIRGEKPQILLEADATDPGAVSYAVSAFSSLTQTALDRDFKGVLSDLRNNEPPFEAVIHRNYNPEINTQANTVPALLGVILTMTMVFITSLAVTREKERGTMENLLSTPLKPAEVMAGKIVPYILIGIIQITLVLLLAELLFHIHVSGSIPLLYVISIFFIATNLSVGITFSSLAKNQLQAVQMSVFFFLPSIILSGFMFPFRGMPEWAQAIGSVLPLTHYLVIVRGIILKDNTFADIHMHFWPIVIFLAAVLLLGILRYRRTLD